MSFLTSPILFHATPLDLLILVLLVAVFPLISWQTGKRFAQTPPDHDRRIFKYFQVMGRSWILLALLALAWWVNHRNISDLGLHAHLRIWDYAGFALAVLVVLAMQAQLLPLAKAPDEKLQSAQKLVHSPTARITPTTGGELLVFLFMAINAGIWEELLYRGFLFWLLSPVTGPLGAAIGSSLVFGLAHIYQGKRGVLMTGLIGLALALAYWLTGSLYWLIVIHALVDMSGGLLVFRLRRILARRNIA